MERPSPFKLVAGHIALDFANTLDNRYDPERIVDLIATYGEFLRFCRESGIITPQQAAALARLGKGTEAALRQACGLREAVERIFAAAAAQRTIPEVELSILTGSVRSALQRRTLRQGAGGVQWRWTELEKNASGPIWPIAAAAADLLVSEDLKRVRECGSETCRWLFLDTSKNHSRRWCDMKLCGNRTKARTFYKKGRTEIQAR